MTRLILGLLLAGIIAISATPAAAADETSWVRIDVPGHFVDNNGVKRSPSCSGGPELIDTPFGEVPQPANTDYAFFVRPGKPSKLAIFFDGGGACWDANTCVGSAVLGASIYSQTVDETVEGLNASEGLGDFDNPENPIADYTQVFIPYCTGDLHTGAADTEYTLPPELGSLNWTIHHRGADNVAAVLDWLTDYYTNEVGRAPGKVFLSGASAGGYGVLYHYPAVAALLPWYTKTRVLVDAANGVINQDFYNRALTPNGVWGVWENLAPELANAFSSGPDELAIEIFKSLGAYYPRTRFGQYTTAYDATQIGFFNIARNLESPELWLDPTELAAAAFEWTLRARTYMILTAFQTWNYRFYLAAGTDHTIVASNKYYLEDSAQGVALVDWLDDMVNRRWLWRSDWRNVRCTPNCLP
jgi:hypothetical protein